MGQCEEDRTLTKKIGMSSKLWSEETDERICDRMMEEDYS